MKLPVDRFWFTSPILDSTVLESRVCGNGCRSKPRARLDEDLPIALGERRVANELNAADEVHERRATDVLLAE